jgi:3'-5' exoribonuclease
MVMINNSEIFNLNKGDKVNHFLLIKKSEVKTTKANKQFLVMELGDQSGSITTNLWDEYSQIFHLFKSGEMVKVAGIIEEYQGNLQLRVDTIRLKAESESVTPRDFLPHSLRDLDEMKKELAAFIEGVKNPFLNTLLNNIFQGEKYEKFITAPAGKTIHHAYIHGLIEHTLEIAKICELMASIHTEINKDLIIAAALLHDFAKIEELQFDTNFDYTDTGKLIGHIVLCSLFVQKEIERIKGFPDELKFQLIHLILSHQGKLEFASPVVPKTIEAVTLYHADELSAKSNAYKRAILSDAADSQWTKYSSILSTELFKFQYSSDKIKEEPKSSLFD